jgi:hypothetical protein
MRLRRIPGPERTAGAPHLPAGHLPAVLGPLAFRSCSAHTARVPATIPVDQGPQPAWLDRSVAIAVAMAAAASTVLLFRIAPDPKGYDTHVQLGLSPCGWPRDYGIPCPTCGVTTAACHLVHGQLAAALLAHPFGASAAALGLFCGGFSLACLLRGRSLLDVVARVRWSRWFLGSIVLLAASWGYKYLTFAP